MSAKVRLFDSESGQSAIIGPGGHLGTFVAPFPPDEDLQPVQIFRDYLRTSAGSNDMRVVGTLAAPIDFLVQPPVTADLYITTIDFLIVDTGAGLNEFGSGTPLTNGCQLLWQNDSGSTVIHDALQSNFDFVRLCLTSRGYGNGASTMQLPNAVGSGEAYHMSLDFREVFGQPWGLRLIRGTNQNLTLRIRDTTTTPTSVFNSIAYGFTRKRS